MRSRRITRWVAGAVVLLQVTAVLHLALVRHSTCAEHGELVDVPAAAAPASTAPEWPNVYATKSAAGEHEHCLVASLSRVLASPRAGVTLASAPLPTRPPPNAPSLGWATGLAVAPKQSPPRA